MNTFYGILRSISPFKIETTQKVVQDYRNDLIHSYRFTLSGPGNYVKIMAGQEEVLLRNFDRLCIPPFKIQWVYLIGKETPYDLTFIDSNHEIVELELSRNTHDVL